MLEYFIFLCLCFPRMVSEYSHGFAGSYIHMMYFFFLLFVVVYIRLSVAHIAVAHMGLQLCHCEQINSLEYFGVLWLWIMLLTC